MLNDRTLGIHNFFKGEKNPKKYRNIDIIGNFFFRYIDIGFFSILQLAICRCGVRTFLKFILVAKSIDAIKIFLVSLKQGVLFCLQRSDERCEESWSKNDKCSTNWYVSLTISTVLFLQIF